MAIGSIVFILRRGCIDKNNTNALYAAMSSKFTNSANGHLIFRLHEYDRTIWSSVSTPLSLYYSLKSFEVCGEKILLMIHRSVRRITALFFFGT